MVQFAAHSGGTVTAWQPAINAQHHDVDREQAERHRREGEPVHAAAGQRDQQVRQSRGHRNRDDGPMRRASGQRLAREKETRASLGIPGRHPHGQPMDDRADAGSTAASTGLLREAAVVPHEGRDREEHDDRQRQPCACREYGKRRQQRAVCGAAASVG